MCFCHDKVLLCDFQLLSDIYMIDDNDNDDNNGPQQYTVEMFKGSDEGIQGL